MLSVALATLLLTAIAIAGDNVVIVLDDSGSMNEKMGGGVRRIDAAKKAITQVLKQFPDDTKLGLMLLNGDRSKQHWAVPLQQLSVVQATQRVEAVKADGGTPLGERMREGADALLQLREKQIYGNYRLLIVTDGEASDKKQLDSYLPDVLARGLVVDAIGVDMKQDHTLATRVHSYRRADDAAALSKAIEEVFAERVDSGLSSSEMDFSLLQAFDDATAKEALSALAKPNNTAIVAVSPNKLAWATAQNNTPTGGDTSARAIPVSTPNASNQSRGTSVFATILITMTICMLPLLVLVAVVIAFVSKMSGGQNRNRPRR